MSGLYANVCFLARSKSGKTTALKKLLPSLKGFHKILMSNVEQFDREHKKDTFHEVLEYSQEGWERLKLLIRVQKELKKRGHKNKLLIVLDDAISDCFDHAYLGECLSQCRHYNCKFIVFTQNVTATLKPVARQNIHVWLVGQVSREALEYIYPATNFNNLADMCAAYQENAKKYHFWRLNSANLPDAPRVIDSRNITLADICE